MITFSNYVKAESLEEAYNLAQKKTNVVLGGGLWIRMAKKQYQTAIDLSALGLNQIEETEEEFKIGAMVTLRQLELHQGLAAYTQRAVKEAVRHIVGVQFRNLATVGGSIYSRFGFSDVLTLFLVMDCQVVLYKEGQISIKEYAARDHHERDLLTHVVIRKKPGRFVYQSVRNSATDFPVLAHCAVAWENGRVDMAIGARPGKAILCENVTDAKEVAAKVPTGTNTRGSREYRSHLVKVLSQRALDRLQGQGASDKQLNQGATDKQLNQGIPDRLSTQGASDKQLNQETPDKLQEDRKC